MIAYKILFMGKGYSKFNNPVESTVSQAKILFKLRIKDAGMKFTEANCIKFVKEWKEDQQELEGRTISMEEMADTIADNIVNSGDIFFINRQNKSFSAKANSEIVKALTDIILALDMGPEIDPNPVQYGYPIGPDMKADPEQAPLEYVKAEEVAPVVVGEYKEWTRNGLAKVTTYGYCGQECKLYDIEGKRWDKWRYFVIHNLCSHPFEDTEEGKRGALEIVKMELALQTNNAIWKHNKSIIKNK